MNKFKSLSLSNPLFLVFYALIFSIGAYLLIRTFAAPPATPSVYVTPASQTLPVNTTFTVQIKASSGSTEVNAVQANLSYPVSLLEFVSINTENSNFGIEAEAVGGSGSINIARGNTSAVSGDLLVAEITFQTLTSSGTANLDFTSGTVLIDATTNNDILGSSSAMFGGLFEVDATPPTVSIGAPADGAIVPVGDTTQITVNATDNTSVASVEILIDGTSVATLTSSPYTYNWNTSGVSKTTHTIQARASDPYGNTATSSIITVTIADLTPPVVQITSPVSGNTVGGAVAFTASSTDGADGDGVNRVEFYVDGVLVHTDTSSPYSFQWDSKSVSDGNHSLTARAYDNASPANSATSEAVNITVDNADSTPPSTPGSLTISGRTTSSLTLTWTASTDNIGVAGYRVSRNGSEVATVNAGTHTYTDTGLSNNTSYAYDVAALDQAGNLSTPAQISGTTLRLIIGDVNEDGVVNVLDLSIMLERWKTNDSDCDLNGDGIVDIFDLSILLSHWGES